MIVNGYTIEPGADLREANLRGADLREADLYGADLYGADLYGADLYGAKNILSIGPSITGRMWYVVKHPETIMIKAGCRWFSIEEAREHWNRPANDPYWRGGGMDSSSSIRRTEINIERLAYLDFIEKVMK